MFWNRSDKKSAKGARNVRKNTWRPENTPNLLDRASAAIPDQTKAFERLKRDRQEALSSTKALAEHTNINVHPSPGTSRFADETSVSTLRESPSPSNELFQPLSNPRSVKPALMDNGLMPEDPFSISLSDIAKRPTEALNSTSHPSSSTQTPEHLHHFPNTSIELPTNIVSSKKHSPYGWNLGILILLWLGLMGAGWLLDPLLWQWWRSKQTLESKVNIVLMTIRDEDIPLISEDDYFQGIGRLLRSNAKAIGFLETPHRWLPNPQDNLPFERLSQTLGRYSHVVIGLDSALTSRVSLPSMSFKELDNSNFLRLPSQEFNETLTLSLKLADEGLLKLLPRVSVGFVAPPFEGNRIPVASWGISPLLIQSSPRKSLVQSQDLENFLPSFAARVAMTASDLRPTHFRSGHTWWGNSIVARRNFWNVRYDGAFAPLQLAANASPILSISWREWLQRGDAKDLSDKVVLVGRLNEQALSLPTKNFFESLVLSWSMQEGLTLEPPMISHQSTLMLQAQDIANLMSGQTSAVPHFSTQTFISFVALLLALLCGSIVRYLLIPLFILIAGLTLGISLLPGFAMGSSAFAAMILLPLTWWLMRPQQVGKSYPKMFTFPQSSDLSSTSSHSSTLPHANTTSPIASKKSPPDFPYSNDPFVANKTPQEKTSPFANLLREHHAPIKPTFVSSTESSSHFQPEVHHPAKPESPSIHSAPANSSSPDSHFKSDIFSDRALSDQAQVMDDVKEALLSLDNTPSHGKNYNGLQDEKMAWMRETESHSIHQSHSDSHGAPIEEPMSKDWKVMEGREMTQVVDEVIRPITSQLSPTLHGDTPAVSAFSAPIPDFSTDLSLTQRVDTQGFNQIIAEQLTPISESAPPQSSQAKALSSPHEENIGHNQDEMHIGRYVVERVLGRGAMGVVYLGLDPHINRKVAIKTVPMPSEDVKGENQQLAAKFFREAQAAGKLTHPGIVTVFDAGLYRQNVYIAMEYLEGRDLSAYTDSRKLLPLATTLNVVARVAEALHFAHERGVVHRDIKPANIIFDSINNIVKVTDFGIAYIHDSKRAMTQVLVGSPNYMSPEHLTGETLDGRTDLFSLGVTLYVLACGTTPFSGDNVNRLMYSILNEPPRDIRSFNPLIPDALIAILHRALQKDRQYRYSSGASMAQDLMIALKTLDRKM